MIFNMVWCKVEKLVVLMYFLWWSPSIHVKAEYDNLKRGDTLKPGDTLNSTSRLCSKNGNYCMSFETFKNNDEEYLSIYVPKGDLAWFSDRNHPVDHLSAVLSLNHSGVLKIESQHGKPIILYSPPHASAINNMVATLLDSGNFVLQQLHSNGTKSVVLWQSFDYPVNYLIPTMKLGVNHKTGHNWSLVSCLTVSLSFPGAFSLEWEPKTRELIIKRRGKVCWRSGKLINNRFEHIPEKIQRMYQYTIVSNRDEDSFSFQIKTQNKVKFPAWRLYETGQLNSDEGDIARADMCYGYNTEGGCQRWEDIPTCREPGDVFQRKIGRANCTDTIGETNPGYGNSDCKAMCWSNCNCTGYDEYYVNGTGCVLFLCPLEDNILDDSGFDLYMLVRIAPHGGTKRRWIWISAVTAATLLIICAFILCLALQKRKYWFKGKSKIMETKGLDLIASERSSDIKDLEDDLKNGHDIKVFNYTSVLTATNDFSPKNKLGQGGFGPVYKGILPTGQEVAVKRLSKNSGQGVVEFKNELTLICELQHTNLVQLLGCCIHEEERILLYEYMPNKSLDFYLFGEEYVVLYLIMRYFGVQRKTNCFHYYAATRAHTRRETLSFLN